MIGFTYITTNKNKTTLYVGATNNLERRITEHKTKKYRHGFSARYSCDYLVYFETFEKINDAFLREKQLKAGNRKKKELLINLNNSEWNDLAANWQNDGFIIDKVGTMREFLKIGVSVTTNRLLRFARNFNKSKTFE